MSPPDIGEIYTRSAMEAHIHANPIIVIPGILGSKLKEKNTGQIVWGAFEKGAANPQTAEGGRLISLPMKKGVPLKDIKDNVVSDGALDKVRVRLFGLPLELNAYIGILSTLGAGGFIDESLAMGDKKYEDLMSIDYGKEHFTCFQFDYDWRRDNVENAKLLHEFILEKKKFIEDKRRELNIETAGEEVKFNIVAHSMGGIIARYFLRYGSDDLPSDGSIPEPTWEGAKLVDNLITIGTPNAGSSEVIDDLIEGKDIALFIPSYEAAQVGTMPSLYQLIPRERHNLILDSDGSVLDMFDPELWKKKGWGLADPEQEEVIKELLPDIDDPEERKEIAHDHLEKVLKRAKHFQDTLDSPANPPSGLSINLVAGDAIPTTSVLKYDDKNKKFIPIEKAPGDKTVTRESALMDERRDGNWGPELRSPIKWDNVTFIFTDHLGLTKDPTFTDNILFLLLEQPRK